MIRVFVIVLISALIGAGFIACSSTDLSNIPPYNAYAGKTGPLLTSMPLEYDFDAHKPSQVVAAGTSVTVRRVFLEKTYLHGPIVPGLGVNSNIIAVVEYPDPVTKSQVTCNYALGLKVLPYGYAEQIIAAPWEPAATPPLRYVGKDGKSFHQSAAKVPPKKDGPIKVPDSREIFFPSEFKISDGGPFEGYAIELEKGKFWYFHRENQKIQKRKLRLPSDEDWRAFWSSVEKNGIWKWQGKYVFRNSYTIIQDGPRWAVRIFLDDTHRLDASGEDVYPSSTDPKRSAQLPGEKESFGALEKAVWKLFHLPE